MNKLKERILNDEKKVAEILPIQAMKLPPPTPLPPFLPPALITPPPQDQMILMSMALVYLQSLPSVFVYFLHITLFSLKIKNSSMKKGSNTKKTSYALEKKYNK